jgi:hypothetical protein
MLLRQESGVALTTSLMLMAVLTLMGTAAIVTGIIETKIGGNYKTSAQAFYTAETGLEEARARLRAQTAADAIDTSSTPPQWKAYIASGVYPQATALQKAVALGYNATNHSLYYSRQSTLDYTVVIEPVAGTPGQLRITSHGAISNAQKRLQMVVVQPPAFAVPAALYVETNTRVQGATVEVIGMDSCGNDHKRGVVTTLPQIQDGQDTVQRLSGPMIMGSPQDIQYEGTNLDIQAMVHTLREYANFTYTVSNATHTHSTTPGPGDHWGQPTLGPTLHDRSTCDDYNVIHYDTGGTYINLSDKVSGCGLLLVQGDLQLSDGFSWYGLILVTGTVYFAGSELLQTQIRGAVLSEASVGLNRTGVASHIVYCSEAANIHRLLLRVLSWKDVYDTP